MAAVYLNKLFKALFFLMILLSVYDKSGLSIGLGHRAISLTFYRLIFLVLTIWLVISYLMSKFNKQAPITGKAPWLNPILFQIIAVSIAIQTLISLGANLIYRGPVTGPAPLFAELYYFIQKAHWVLIPLFAVQARVAPKTLLKVFLAAVVIHISFIIMQSVSPQTYIGFMNLVHDPLRKDNIVGWDGRVWAPVGLQRTQNYGEFVAAFGLLALAFKPKNFALKLLRLVLVLFSLTVSLSGQSRATLIVIFLTLGFYFYKTKIFSKLVPTIVFLGLTTTVGLLWITNSIPEQYPSLITRSILRNEQKASSNDSKIQVAKWGTQLIAASPVYGYGQRRFIDLTIPLGNDTTFSILYSHSYVLNIALTTGLVGLAISLFVFWRMLVRLWPVKTRDYQLVTALFIGLAVYNILYDAGHLDVFACLTGVLAYYALMAKNQGRYEKT